MSPSTRLRDPTSWEPSGRAVDIGDELVTDVGIPVSEEGTGPPMGGHVGGHHSSPGKGPHTGSQYSRETKAPFGLVAIVRNCTPTTLSSNAAMSEGRMGSGFHGVPHWRDRTAAWRGPLKQHSCTNEVRVCM